MNMLGSIQLSEVEVLSRFAGRDFIPFPFSPTLPNQHVYADDYDAFAASVIERYRYGDLQVFTKWARAYEEADIRVECRVLFASDKATPVRIVAHRQDQFGYHATQRAGDVVEVHTLSPYELGPAIADAVTLSKPGKRSEIAVPGNLVPQIWLDDAAAQILDDADRTVFSVREKVIDRAVPQVSHPDLAASGTVQSHWRPSRRWGFDRGKNALVWVSVKDDGDYICIPGSAHAKPMSRNVLPRQIDELIAEDVSVLREFRSGSA